MDKREEWLDSLLRWYGNDCEVVPVRDGAEVYRDGEFVAEEWYGEPGEEERVRY